MDDQEIRRMSVSTPTPPPYFLSLRVPGATQMNAASLTCVSQLACCCVKGYDEQNSPDVRYSLSVLRLGRRCMMSQVQVLRFWTIIKRTMSYTMISMRLPPTSYYWSDSEGMEECDKQSCYQYYEDYKTFSCAASAWGRRQQAPRPYVPRPTIKSTAFMGRRVGPR